MRTGPDEDPRFTWFEVLIVLGLFFVLAALLLWMS